MLLSLAFSMALYLFICYVYYRIAQKFDNTASYLQMLIPLWNYYLILKIAQNKSFANFFFLGSVIVNVMLAIAIKYYHYSVLITASNLFSALIVAIPIALIAQKLGKNFWLYFIFMQIPPLIHFWVGFIVTTIVPSILAFDSSKPAPPAMEEIHNTTV